MSKGKKGEMRTTEMVSIIGRKEPSVDFTRFSTTNTPDNGSDLFIHASPDFIEKMKEIADTGSSNIICDNSSKVIIRVDVKNNEKVGKDDAEKFADDINKHPKSSAHILVGNKFTSGAKKILDEAKEHYPKKSICYFDENDVRKIESFYRSQPDYSEEIE